MYPNQISCFVVKSSVIVCLIPNISLMRSLVILSLLDLPAALLKKSISFAFSVANVLSFSGHTSQLYKVILFTIVSYILFLFSLLMDWSNNMLIYIVMAFLPGALLSLMALSNVPSCEIVFFVLLFENNYFCVENSKSEIIQK
ncbi:unnamed protein product [Diabrotica balteata]|uniref:Uncharacterized protein n=1 Tax=Diabrotica balteata TaxID=107213 RepID=A0A9P0DVT1_DIABA|nr:unnamed protein product [Diabrotica balteata]